MKKDIKSVRRSINERKKTRGLPINTTKRNKVSTVMPSLPQDEEKHGFYPNFFENTSSNQEKSNTITNIILKGLFSVMLFFSVAIIWQNDADVFEKPKDWVAGALTEEFPFATVYQWYEDSFGTPLAFSPNKEVDVEEGPLALPVSGDVIETFQTNGKGIMIAPTGTSSVQALQDGIVIFSGKKPDTNKTVIIQHADQSTSTYGFLSSVDVHLYQIVGTHQRIGEFAPSDDNEMVYFSVEQNDEYVDPVQVIEVDDKP